jgi:tRNA threonylcarbamoyladenosine biosynthesis protein TsaE
MSESKLKLVVRSEDETARLGKRIGAAIQIGPDQPGLVIAMNGTLGAGKTRITQAIALGLDVESQVTSPTYTICIPYRGRVNLLHLDAYRIKHAEEVDELDLDYRVQEGDVLIVEWADRIKSWMPDIDLQIDIESSAEDVREFSFESFSAAGRTIIDALGESFESE